MIKDAFTIETQNLILRALTPELYQYVFTHFNDEELKIFFGHETEEAFNKEKQMFEQGLIAYNKSFFIFQLIEKSNLKNIGWCGYHNIATRHNRAEIGYVINNKNNWGKGFMKEALHEVLCYGFEELKLHRIEAITGRENLVSQKLLKDRGFIYEGLLREHYFTNNVYEDSLMFSLMKNELIRFAF